MRKAYLFFLGIQPSSNTSSVGKGYELLLNEQAGLKARLLVG